MDQHRYRVGDFARAGGISVRTLHHYDRLGLVTPAGRDDTGYRYYTSRELVALQQVLTLRYLGFPLRRIGELMGRPGFDVEASLRAQRRVLQERRDEIDDVASALDRMLQRFEQTSEWDWSLVSEASREASRALARKENTMDQEEMMKRFEELGAQLAPGERERIEQDWAALMAEVQASIGLDVHDPKAVALAERWEALRLQTEAAYTSRGFGDLWQAVGENYRNGSMAQNPNAPSMEVMQFMSKVLAAREAS
jgi:DNA-binding transcriptional MerR regulator